MAKTVWALIHEAKAKNRLSYGISFPDFPGVVSAGSSVDDAVERGRKLLAFHVAGMVEDGDDIPEVRSLTALRNDRDFAEEAADVKHVCVVEVPLELPSRQVRVNISIEDRLLSAIDKSAERSGKTRSAFIAEAARQKLKLGVG
ncbi:MAG: type II toxin-antitoxin system HicB family antitoxin [Proteobacteria bacterium]|nr:type II toxin-antitoxin system HicB family antitoxin [Pseudomonadota bacterium]